MGDRGHAAQLAGTGQTESISWARFMIWTFYGYRRFMIWTFQVFGGTNSLDRVLHLLWMVQTQTAGSYSFSDGTTALWLHFLLGTNWILLFPNRTENLQSVGELKQ